MPPVFQQLNRAEYSLALSLTAIALTSFLMGRSLGEVQRAKRAARAHELDVRKREASLQEREELLAEQQRPKAQAKAQAEPPKPRGRARSQE